MSTTQAAQAEFQNGGKPVAQPWYLVDISGNPIMPVATARGGYVTPNSNNAAALTSATDYTFKWGTDAVPITANHVMIQNNTATNLNFDLDVVATAGSPILAPGATLFLDVQTTVLHFYQVGTPNVNGTTAGNIAVRGWL